MALIFINASGHNDTFISKTDQLRRDRAFYPLHRSIFEKKHPFTFDIGPLVRFIRKQRNLTQAELSKLTRLKQQTISAIENGTQQAKLKTLFAILSTLNLELVVRQRSTKHSGGYAPGRKS
jgi:HTH-type transcriptional regulator/antitoxin HipB